jgi:cobalt-zinc-cadmium efflux system membrane fusion protein
MGMGSTSFGGSLAVLLYLGVVTVGVGLTQGCGRGNEEVSAPKPTTPEGSKMVVRLKPEATAASGIEVRPLARRDFRRHRDFPGTVTSNENELAEVTTLVRGRVVKVFVDVGRDVKAGEALALIDSTELGLAQAAYLKAAARLHEAELAYERARDLHHDRAISVAEVQKREAEMITARSEAREAHNRLGLLGMAETEVARLEHEHKIRSSVGLPAPFAGRVIARNITRGEVVEPTQKLFTVADLSNVWVVANVPEKDVRFIHKDQSVEVRLLAYPGEVYTGMITYIGDVLDPATRTMKLRVTVPNPQPARPLKPEMFSTVRVHATPERDVLTIPLTAVHRDQGDPVAFVRLSPDQFEARSLKLGEENGEEVKVLDGLREGEEVVMKGGFVLKSEAEKHKVEPVR